mgnify:CR=1 FL=1
MKADFKAIPVLAYLDPGTGSLVIQMVAAAIFGSLAAISMFWSRIKEFIRNLTVKKGAEEGSDEM